jgi:hypothetical protein
MAALFGEAGADPPDPERRRVLLEKYALCMDMASLPRLMREHGLA